MVTVVLFVNQVLFTIYALRVRDGDMSYLAIYVPDGWFELADGPVMTWLAEHTPAPELLAVCALRVPSLFELPLGMLAYLTVLNWLDPSLYRRLTSTTVIALMSASYSITFGLIEWELHTPYTVQNLALRLLSGIVTVFALRRLGRLPSAPQGSGAPRTAAELLAFAASTAALGYLVLALYDTVLLYSMGRVGEHVPGAVAAGTVLVAARFAAARLRRRPAEPVPRGSTPVTAGSAVMLGTVGSGAGASAAGGGAVVLGTVGSGAGASAAGGGAVVLGTVGSGAGASAAGGGAVVLGTVGSGAGTPVTVGGPVTAGSTGSDGGLLTTRADAGKVTAGPGVGTLTAGMSWWLALFLVPALAIRYELGFGSWLLAASAGLLIIGAATAFAIFEVYGSLPRDGRAAAARRWLLGLVAAGLSATAAAAVGLAVPAVHPEMRLLSAAALFVLTATVVCAAWDRHHAGEPAR
ncbi:hypothetical protein MB27_26365 [Actinoplanes utahensis]|uniref:Uncharacterized protein n=1 Tax=Actinoplanes utahensis TaxID=1869 RepID=A0A0A6UFQ2_ACTUT|nr:hypothetical protein MB27_26365 [Actinoplanes utahensis]